ncbi:hypothetical protein L3Q82_012840 [Scortum barcoo]|uniref:Uncharacterized protein n=1 Tax=Scortum barcoo TaxID=214431 RepID=A0ACB8VY88_9TELE|nr:hypothetical protein L3Q82_012840 [Scortum barcoo]
MKTRWSGSSSASSDPSEDSFSWTSPVPSIPSSPLCFRDKLSRMGVDPQLMDWISDYLTGRPQYAGLKDITSDIRWSAALEPPGHSAGPSLFTLYTSDFCYNSELCHIQKVR